MNRDKENTKEQLINEIAELRQRVAQLEAERKLAKETLREVSEKYSAIFDGSRDGIVLVDSETGYIVDCNQEFEWQTGRSLMQLKKTAIWELRPPEQIEIAKKKFSEIRDKGVGGSDELVFQKPSGEVIPIDFLTRTITLGGRKYLQSMTRDITERKKVEESLRASEAKYRNLVENAPIGISIHTTDGQVEYHNRKLMTMHGYDYFNEFMKIPPADLYTDPEGRKLLLEKARQGPVNNFEALRRRKDGSLFWQSMSTMKQIDESGKEKLIIVSQDITERKVAEAALKESEAKYRNVVELAEDGICIIQNMLVKYCNPQLAEMWGGTVEEAKDTPFSNYLHPDALPEVVERYNRRKAGGQVPFRYETALRKKDGAKVDVELNVGIIDYLGQQAEIVIVHDITARKQAEEGILTMARQWETTFDAMSDAVCLTDRENKVLRCNKALTELLGKPFSEIIGRTCCELMHGTSDNIKDCPVVKMNQTRRRETLSIQIGDRWLDITAEPILDGSGNITGAVHVIADITAHKKEEEELALRATLLDAATDAIHLREMDGRIVYTNDTALKQYGYNRDEFIGMNARQLRPPDIRDGFGARLQEAREKGSVILETTHQRKDKTIFPAESHYRIIESGGKEYVLSVVRDITVRKQREEALRASEAKFRNLVENAPVGIGMTAFDGRVIFRNKAFSDFSGYSADELLNISPVTRYYDPKDRERFIELVRKGLVRDYETRMKRKDGGTYWMSFTGIPQQTEFGDGYLTVVQDITSRKVAEEALKESEQRLKEAQVLGEMGNWEFDLATQKIEWSDEVYTLYERDKALGPPSPDEEAGYYTPEEARRLRNFARAATEKGEEFNYDFAANLPTGKTVFFHGVMRPVKDEKGCVIKLFGTVQNITERKKAEEALRKSEELYRSLFENILNGYAYCKMLYNRNQPPDFIYLNVNKAFEPLTGLKNVVGKRVSEVIPGIQKSDPGLLEIYSRVASTGIPERFETYLTAMGMWFSISVYSPEKEYFVAIFDVITERKRAEEALKASEEKFRNLVENAPVGIGITTLEGRPLFRNKTLVEMTGYTSEELLKIPIRERYDDPKDWERYVQLVRKGLFKDFEAKMKRKDGTFYWVSFTGIPQQTEFGDGYISIAQDITQRKLAEEALLESNRRFEDIAENALGWIWEVDIDGKYTYASSVVESILGYKSDEIVGKYFYDLFHPDDREKLKKEAFVAFAEKQPFRHLVNRNIHKNGKIVWLSTSATPILDDKGNLLGFRGSDSDFTESKKAEEALRESEAKFRNLVENAPINISISTFDGSSVFRNRNLLQLSGYTLEELAKIPVKERYYDPKDWERLTELVKKGIVRGFEARMKRKDGSIYWLASMAIPYKTEYGDGYMIAAQDITERKQSEEKMKEMEMKAQIASRLASIGQMAAGIAHEINNPLTPTIGFAEMLLKRDLPEDVKSDLRVIHSSAKRAADVTKRLLTFARQTAPERDVTDINEIIESTINLRAYRLTTGNIKVIKEFDSKLPEVMADAGQLQQVFLNLIMNAEYEMSQTHGGGTLLIKTERVGDTIRVSIKDDGPGISSENMDKLFTPFFTTKRVGEGTGLGLSICHGIITEHNGRIYAESEFGKGATFIIELPVITQEKEEAVEAKLPEPDTGRAEKTVKTRILVVDDEPSITRFLKRALAEEGYEIKATGKAGYALRLIKGGKYALILLDIKMPDMSGIEMYEQLEKTDKSLTERIIFITGDVSGPETMNFFSRTGVSYVSKPFSIEQVKEEVKSKLSLRR